MMAWTLKVPLLSIPRGIHPLPFVNCGPPKLGPACARPGQTDEPSHTTSTAMTTARQEHSSLIGPSSWASPREPPTTSHDGASTASVHPANARDLVRKSPDILRRKILDTLLRVNRELGRGRCQGESLAAGSSRPRGYCAPYGQGRRCAWMLPPRRVPFAPWYPVAVIENVSLVPGSPPSVTLTVKVLRPLLKVPEIVLAQPGVKSVIE